MRRHVASSLLLVLLVELLLAMMMMTMMHAGCAAYSSPPTFGIGALLFRPITNVRLIRSSEYDHRDDNIMTRRRRGAGKEEMEEMMMEEDALAMAGRFFVDAFWRGKAGGPDELSQSQSRIIEKQQVAEFRKRYGDNNVGGGKGRGKKGGGTTTTTVVGRLPGNYATRASSSSDTTGGGGRGSGGGSSRKEAELVLCVASDGTCVGCAGIEISKIKKMDGYDNTYLGPVMSNLAVDRKYRRRGLAERLVGYVENLAMNEWGYDVCYLYVEERNLAAKRLYEKLGYRVLWTDDTATTLLPSRGDGGLINVSTTVVCMKKELGGNAFLRYLFRR